MVRIGIISDIHGNCVALEAALDDLARQGVDRVVCLGDAIQGGAQPASTVARLRELDCPIVMGNADAFVLSGEVTDSEPAPPRLFETREWTLGQLSSEDLGFMQRFQPTIEVPLEAGRTLLCFHGSPASFDEIILPETNEEEFQRMLGAFHPAIMTGGHTHLQQIRRLGAGFFFNPGSVGLAYDRYLSREELLADAWAEYAILSSDGPLLSLEFRRVPFDTSVLIEAILSSGMPHAESVAARHRRT